MKRLPLRSFRLQNFKAVRDSGTVKFGPLTVFVGNNGSGKSSLIEGLETLRDIVFNGLDSAMNRWRGFEHVWNHAVPHDLQPPIERAFCLNPMIFHLDLDGSLFEQKINMGEALDNIFIQHEECARRVGSYDYLWERDANGRVTLSSAQNPSKSPFDKASLEDGTSYLSFYVQGMENWVFLALDPQAMCQPVPQQRSRPVKLARDGRNIAQYLNEIRKQDDEAFEKIVESVRYVLPYLVELQPTLVTELERAYYLRLKEAEFDVAGWLLSTGTMRIVAILACLHHPSPPPVLVIEEIENGLDPRTLQLLVEEIRVAIDKGQTQVIATTHSPYFLDLLDLSHIVIVEREDGQPTFKRPNKKELAVWSKSFSPGRLYTMGRLTRQD